WADREASSPLLRGARWSNTSVVAGSSGSSTTGMNTTSWRCPLPLSSVVSGSRRPICFRADTTCCSPTWGAGRPAAFAISAAPTTRRRGRGPRSVNSACPPPSPGVGPSSSSSVRGDESSRCAGSAEVGATPRIGITMPPRSPWTGFDRVGNGRGRSQSGVGRLLGEG
ncbi:MAG: hypothetical protein AVDCRST_MAG10-139, partial [uncultured Acidimicrobiales bacterium]